MRDFSGSTVVHSLGGWAALAGHHRGRPAPRPLHDGAKPATVPGHNMGYVFLGGMILWLGWFGFNPGSTMAVDPDAIARIAVTTKLSPAPARWSPTLYAWWRHGKPDFSLTVNGCLAGLVSITAPCAYVTPGAALVIGTIAGVTVIEAVELFDRLAPRRSGRRDLGPPGARHLRDAVRGPFRGERDERSSRTTVSSAAVASQQLGPSAPRRGRRSVPSRSGRRLLVWYAIKKCMGLRVTAAARGHRPRHRRDGHGGLPRGHRNRKQGVARSGARSRPPMGPITGRFTLVDGPARGAARRER